MHIHALNQKLRYQLRLPQDILSTKLGDFCIPLGQESLEPPQHCGHFLVRAKRT